MKFGIYMELLKHFLMVCKAQAWRVQFKVRAGSRGPGLWLKPNLTFFIFFTPFTPLCTASLMRFCWALTSAWNVCQLCFYKILLRSLWGLPTPLPDRVYRWLLCYSSEPCLCCWYYTNHTVLWFFFFTYLLLLRLAWGWWSLWGEKNIRRYSLSKSHALKFCTLVPRPSWVTCYSAN